MKTVGIILAVIFLGGCGQYAPEVLNQMDQDSFATILETDPRPAAQIFEEDVFPNTEKSCKRCHESPAPDRETALTHIVPGNPDESVLYQKATGKGHMRIWKEGSENAEKLRHWIEREEV